MSKFLTCPSCQQDPTTCQDRGLRSCKPQQQTAAWRDQVTVGFEIEFVGIDQYQAISALQAAGLPVLNGATSWTYGNDSSCGEGRIVAGEVLAPIVRYGDVAGWAGIERGLQVLSDAGARVQASCGTHMHVLANGFTPAGMAAVAHSYAGHPEVRYLTAPSRRPGGRKHHFCKAIPATLLASFRSYALATGDLGTFGGRQSDRYYEVNISSLWEDRGVLPNGETVRTLEFRAHHGTLAYKKLRAWASAMTALIGMAVYGSGCEGGRHGDLLADLAKYGLAANERRLLRERMQRELRAEGKAIDHFDLGRRDLVGEVDGISVHLPNAGSSATATIPQQDRACSYHADMYRTTGYNRSDDGGFVTSCQDCRTANPTECTNSYYSTGDTTCGACGGCAERANDGGPLYSRTAA